MNTDDLIDILSLDATLPQPSPPRLWLKALGISVAASAVLMAVTLQVRPDVMNALWTVRFDFKFVVALCLAVPACLLARRLADPTTQVRLAPLALAPVLLAVAVMVELAVLPRATWQAALVGTNSLWCLGSIPVFSAPVLAALFLALRRGAPINARLAGLVAGLAAGGLGASIYAAHCTDDSPLFVATWYTIAIALVTMAGAALGPRLLRW